MNPATHCIVGLAIFAFSGSVYGSYLDCSQESQRSISIVLNGSIVSCKKKKGDPAGYEEMLRACIMSQNDDTTWILPLPLIMNSLKADIKTKVPELKGDKLDTADVYKVCRSILGAITKEDSEEVEKLLRERSGPCGKNFFPDNTIYEIDDEGTVITKCENGEPKIHACISDTKDEPATCVIDQVFLKTLTESEGTCKEAMATTTVGDVKKAVEKLIAAATATAFAPPASAPKQLVDAFNASLLELNASLINFVLPTDEEISKAGVKPEELVSPKVLDWTKTAREQLDKLQVAADVQRLGLEADAWSTALDEARRLAGRLVGTLPQAQPCFGEPAPKQDEVDEDEY